ncbi:MAG: hypothetical protein KatS3mg061_0687 [Dehalococcoidia bacterium]|nr:MAG: hypothetical protein KatS3mg061_0687 [Dehalococcoidia bacterium]
MLDDGVLAAEEELGQRSRQLGLPDPGRAKEDEGADRSLGVLEPRARPPDRLRNDRDRLILADHPLVERLLHVDETLALVASDADDGDPRPHRDDLGNVVGR